MTMTETETTLQKLREREARIKRRMREIQSRTKSDERKRRSAKLIRWGVVVEALLKSGEIDAVEWVNSCRQILKSERDKEIATSNLIPSLPNEAHLPVSPAEKQCAPAAGENRED
ncbi:hypothetical protein [Sulfuriferula sp. AH1]|uniref:hypothetical protein n=1 Tax=Sulfuriferula sp. AH1 TaxID=1985873 RepID=UPI0012F87F54|nr:hypothetical protein [Sulfuriferula sp. AH1]